MNDLLLNIDRLIDGEIVNAINRSIMQEHVETGGAVLIAAMELLIGATPKSGGGVYV